MIKNCYHNYAFFCGLVLDDLLRDKYTNVNPLVKNVPKRRKYIFIQY